MQVLLHAMKTLSSFVASLCSPNWDMVQGLRFLTALNSGIICVLLVSVFVWLSAIFCCWQEVHIAKDKDQKLGLSIMGGADRPGHVFNRGDRPGCKINKVSTLDYLSLQSLSWLWKAQPQR